MEGVRVSQTGLTVTASNLAQTNSLPQGQSGTPPWAVRVCSDGNAFIRFGGSTVSATLNDALIVNHPSVFYTKGQSYFSVLGDIASGATVSVSYLAITAGGSYTTQPTITFSSGSATATALMSATSAAVSATGTGYLIGDVLTGAGATGTEPTFTVTQVGASSAAKVSGGTGYSANDVLTVVGGTGSAATITVNTVSSGVISTFTLTSPGSYTVIPSGTLSTTGGTGTGATFTLTMGTVAAVTVATAGSLSALHSNPVSTTGGTGSSATLTVTYTVTGATITAAGSYTYPTIPTVSFSAGAATASVGVTTGTRVSVVPVENA